MHTQHSTLSRAKRGHNKLCKKLLFKEEAVRTEPMKTKIMLEAGQKCFKKQTFSRITPIYMFVFVPLNQATASTMSFLPHLWLRQPQQQKYPPGFHLRLTGTYLLSRLVLIKQLLILPDLHCMYIRKREL